MAVQEHGDTAHTLGDTSTPAHAGTAFMQAVRDHARAHPTTIVLPESEDERILTAAARIAADGLCRIALLGKPDTVEATARTIGADIDHDLITVLDTTAPELRARLEEHQRALLASRTRPSQPTPVSDAATAASLLVSLGLADGFVSGAAHTTADTLRPALKLIGTAAGHSLVSSVFFMLLPETVMVFGDCAVIPEPTPEQLAEIAAQSAQTAAAFGLDPKIALLSYSTGTSGSGPAVEKTLSALEHLRSTHPDLACAGPLQFDAAVNPDIAAKKLPDSSVAGQANVLVFPSLEAGNITYKAVQQTSGAGAVGPILQGMSAPVNDLSRGCTVDDIVDTVAVTAVQAHALRRA